MGQLVVDSALLSILRKAVGPTEIRDPQGELLGVFTPTYEDEPDFDLEEIERIAREERDTAIPTAQVLAYLRELERRIG